jgi:hypothetical protein
MSERWGAVTLDPDSGCHVPVNTITAMAYYPPVIPDVDPPVVLGTKVGIQKQSSASDSTLELVRQRDSETVADTAPGPPPRTKTPRHRRKRGPRDAPKGTCEARDGDCASLGLRIPPWPAECRLRGGGAWTGNLRSAALLAVLGCFRGKRLERLSSRVEA